MTVTCQENFRVSHLLLIHYYYPVLTLESLYSELLLCPWLKVLSAFARARELSEQFNCPELINNSDLKESCQIKWKLLRKTGRRRSEQLETSVKSRRQMSAKFSRAAKKFTQAHFWSWLINGLKIFICHGILSNLSGSFSLCISSIFKEKLLRVIWLFWIKKTF